jgi:RNA polymerase sigma factor (sigma-70 family)
MAGDEPSSARPLAGDPGERLCAQERRLRLLLAHLAGRAVRSRFELADLFQDVCLRALADARGLPPEEPGEGPLWRVLAQHARYVVIDRARMLRSAKRSGAGEVRLHPARSGAGESRAGPAAAQPGPRTAAEARESGRTLERCFLGLVPEHRRVIGLRQFEGLSAREAARRMGRSETAVHSLYRRALLAWQEELARSGISPDESAPFLRLDGP